MYVLSARRFHFSSSYEELYNTLSFYVPCGYLYIYLAEWLFLHYIKLTMQLFFFRELLLIFYSFTITVCTCDSTFSIHNYILFFFVDFTYYTRWMRSMNGKRTRSARDFSSPKTTKKWRTLTMFPSMCVRTR